MNRTKIEWVKNPDGSRGYCWNPITGCLGSCGYCYARRLASGRLRAKYLANNHLPPHDEPNQIKHPANPFYPRFWPERLTGLGVRQTPKGIFVCNMCKFFGEWIPTNWQREVFKVSKDNPQHRFYFLTKQPWNVTKFSPFRDNCWIGVTVCSKLT